MKNSSSFFRNYECDNFPCHKMSDIEGFNCLFCFCPLYSLGDSCGGNFVYLNNGVKDCSQCTIPHRGEKGYDFVIKRLLSK